MMRRSDLERAGPLWIKYSEDVRADPDAWQTSGDQYVKVGHWRHPSQVVLPFCVSAGSRCPLRSLMTSAWTCAGARGQTLDSRDVRRPSSVVCSSC